MKIKWFILLLMFSSCFQSEDFTEKTESFNANIDSLFNAADGAVELVTNNRKQKVLDGTPTTTTVFPTIKR